MKQIQLHAVSILAGIVIITVGAAARGEEAQKPAPPGSSPALTRFYSGFLTHEGMFSGKLLCLCCDLMPDTGKPKTCDAHGHHHVLLVEGDLFPLIAGTEETTKQINSDELHGKQVIVTGKYYATTGFILVDNIKAQ